MKTEGAATMTGLLFFSRAWTGAVIAQLSLGKTFDCEQTGRKSTYIQNINVKTSEQNIAWSWCDVNVSSSPHAYFVVKQKITQIDLKK